jgi:hypothetical protein
MESVLIIHSPDRPARIMDPFSALVLLKYPQEYNPVTLKMEGVRGGAVG